MTKHLSLARFFFTLIALTLVVGAQPAVASTPVVGINAGEGTISETADFKAESDLLQFTSGGHVLGFAKDGVIIASGSHMLKVEFIGANSASPQSSGAAAGNGQENPPLSAVTYPDLWDGVTLVYQASEGSLVKSTYYVETSEAGASASSIVLGYNRPVRIDEKGNLVISYETGTLTESAPVAWQEVGGERKAVEADYVLYGEQRVGFSLGDYIPGIPVVIDPKLIWHTFLGGSSTGGDYGNAIAVDGSGNIYVAGTSRSTWGTPVRAYTAVDDAFVAKLDSSGALQWHTFLGGSGWDSGRGIAVDGSGNIYVAGSSDATWGIPLRPYTANYVAFVARLDSSGALQWHTFLGSSGYDSGYAIAVDGSGNIYVTGYSGAAWAETPLRPYTANDDAFVARLDSSGALQWHTFLGGSGTDYGRGIAVDGSGNIYVAGNSNAAWGTNPVRPYS
ncbi:MAG: SBBP repeat-containing protein, partial [Chloroflexi bacterium]|nr:SBBP repeat-containing protein [Chloroflexota bacterium]